MSPKKKTGFFAFVCSLIPGAAEMYMGYMKLGISIMFAFVLVFMIAGFGFGNEVLLFLDIMIWFYSFFHARNLVNTTEEEFLTLKDHYIWEEFIDGEVQIVKADSVRRILAIALIVIGLGMLWGQMESIIYAICFLASSFGIKLLLVSENGVNALNIVDLPEPLSPLMIVTLLIHLVKSIDIVFNPNPLYIPI